MTRYYCDGCGVEINEHNRCHGGALHCPESRLGTIIKTRNGKMLCVEIMTGTDNKWNDGHWCIRCVLDALLALGEKVDAGKCARCGK